MESKTKAPKRRQAIHICDVDFGRLKPGDIYASLCGKRYIAEEAPTPEECEEIRARTEDAPICRKCLAAKARK